MAKDEVPAEVMSAFMNLQPLLDQTARLVTQCPFEDSGSRKTLSLMVAAYFCGASRAVLDQYDPRAPNADRIIQAIRRELKVFTPETPEKTK